MADPAVARLVRALTMHEHLYHSKGWCRELWIKSLGMHAILPPPEEVAHVTTAKEAAEAEQRGNRTRDEASTQ